MGSSEKFCLRWNDFESNISKAFREIREDKDFFDVTLACDDDDQISAHKVILSACSPFFRGVLKRNRHDHPLLYLKGVKYTDLAAVLNFMYHGEVNVAQEDLNTFLSVAEDLKVKGLTQSDSSSSDSSRKDAASAASSNDSNSSRSSNLKSKSRDSPAAAREPPSKKSRPNPPSLTPAPHLTQHNNDDIQEVTPVKTEAIMISQDASGGGGVDGGGSDGGAASLAVEEYNTELVDADYVEDFGDYEAGYDGEAGYDTSIVEDPTHADGNKGKELIFFLGIVRMYEFLLTRLKMNIAHLSSISR